MPPKFKVIPTKNKKQPGQIPKLSALRIGASTAVPPPDVVISKLGCASFIMGVDIETADWVDRRRSNTRKGQFGFYSFCHDDDFEQRIVQIGWAGGPARDGAPLDEYKEYVVRPEGFAISEKAAAKHGITNEHALTSGMPLRDILDKFMDVVSQLDAIGGKVVIHHLEFDAGIIARELVNAELSHRLPLWRSAARNGICTMDPDIGSWVQKCKGRDVTSDEKSLPMLSLKNAVHMLLPKSELAKSLQAHCHTAGADAQLHRLLYIAFMSLKEQALTHV